MAESLPVRVSASGQFEDTLSQIRWPIPDSRIQNMCEMWQDGGRTRSSESIHPFLAGQTRLLE